jgi:transcriptional regulator of heat shock response
MEPVTDRQKEILNHVVDAHIESAQPVGSRLLTERFKLSFSPATVRHEMGVLEDMGYLIQPHTSSGRIPTDFGYRYYVDHGIKQEVLSRSLLCALKERLFAASQEMESFAETVSRLLSSLLEEVSLMLIPDPPEEAFESAKRRKLLLQGTTYLFEKPEFRDFEKIRVLFKAFDEKVILMNWLSRRSLEEEIAITIGHENEPEELHDCSVVSARYAVEGKKGGTIAVVGPCRMKYSRTVSIIGEIARLMGDVLHAREPVE